MADMFRIKAFEYDEKKILEKRGLEDKGRVQQFIDTECLKLCAPKVPKDSGALILSGDNSKIGSGQLEYRTPYARRWYYREASFQGAPERGNYWFSRMAQQHKNQILSGAQKIANGN